MKPRFKSVVSALQGADVSLFSALQASKNVQKADLLGEVTLPWELDSQPAFVLSERLENPALDFAGPRGRESKVIRTTTGSACCRQRLYSVAGGSRMDLTCADRQ